MKIKELLLFLIFWMGMNVSIEAQESADDEYRSVAAWLIEDNLRTTSVKGNPLICSNLLDDIFEFWNFWKMAESNQF